MMWSIHKLIFNTTSMSAKVDKLSFGNKIGRWTVEQKVVLAKLGANFPDWTQTIIAKKFDNKEAINITFVGTTSTSNCKFGRYHPTVESEEGVEHEVLVQNVVLQCHQRTSKPSRQMKNSQHYPRDPPLLDNCTSLI